MPRGQMTDVQKTAARARADARTIVVEAMKAEDFPAAVRTALRTLELPSCQASRRWYRYGRAVEPAYYLARCRPCAPHEGV